MLSIQNNSIRKWSRQNGSRQNRSRPTRMLPNSPRRTLANAKSEETITLSNSVLNRRLDELFSDCLGLDEKALALSSLEDKPSMEEWLQWLPQVFLLDQQTNFFQEVSVTSIRQSRANPATSDIQLPTPQTTNLILISILGFLLDLINNTWGRTATSNQTHAVPESGRLL